VEVVKKEEEEEEEAKAAAAAAAAAVLELPGEKRATLLQQLPLLAPLPLSLP